MTWKRIERFRKDSKLHTVTAHRMHEKCWCASALVAWYVFLCGTLHGFIVHDTRILRDMLRHRHFIGERVYRLHTPTDTSLVVTIQRLCSSETYLSWKFLMPMTANKILQTHSPRLEVSPFHMFYLQVMPRVRGTRKSHVCIRSMKTWFSNKNNKLKRNQFGLNVWENTISFLALFGKSTQNVCRGIPFLHSEYTNLRSTCF